jgi:hypothetical protein
MTKNEEVIVRAAIRGLLAEGYILSVDDFEEEHPKSTNLEEIFSKMGTVDEEHLIATNKFGTRGFVFFVYGNCGWDVICDYSVALESALKEAIELSNTIEAEASVGEQ